MENKVIRDIAIVVVILAAGALVYVLFPTATTHIDVPTDANLSAIQQPKMDTPQPEVKAQLQTAVLKEGSGPGAQNGQTIKVHYTGTLTDGKVFDSSIPRGEPFTLKLGAGQVIPGWELGLLGMKVGEKRRLTIPPELAYGKDGFPGVIPPNATLIFEVELLAIE